MVKSLLTNEEYTVLPERRRSMTIKLGVYLVLAVAGIWWSTRGGSPVLGGIVTVVALGLALVILAGLTLRKYVVKVDDAGVSVQLATGKVMSAAWTEIEAHAIDPSSPVGAVLVKAGNGRVKMLPVSIRLIGPEAAQRLIDAMKERLPRLEYRIPTIGKR